ncbi:NAD(P)/FAD-dependent oxidoreductase [Nocardioides dilutus]
MSRVIVVGAGVVGLSCAARLLADGHRVDVLARDLPRETTSGVAAALWYPYRALPFDRVLDWSRTSYEAFDRLAADAPESGVSMRTGVEVLSGPHERPWWAEAVPDLIETHAVPDGYELGWSFTAPVVEMPVYLDWLAGVVLDRGGTITRINLTGLSSGADVVVNCTGIGSRFLARDLSVQPVQGQVVLVEQVGLRRWWLDSAGPTYVIPRAHDIVLGGSDVEGEWSRTPSPEVASTILRRALRLVPELAGAEVLGHRVGLRPARPEVRLERVDDIVHCYGHGGSGVTVSWGCAEEVAGLVG